MTRCIIVDDEPLAQQVIENHINKTEGLIAIKRPSPSGSGEAGVGSTAAESELDH